MRAVACVPSLRPCVHASRAPVHSARDSGSLPQSSCACSCAWALSPLLKQPANKKDPRIRAPTLRTLLFCDNQAAWRSGQAGRNTAAPLPCFLKCSITATAELNQPFSGCARFGMFRLLGLLGSCLDQPQPTNTSCPPKAPTRVVALQAHNGDSHAGDRRMCAVFLKKARTEGARPPSARGAAQGRRMYKPSPSRRNNVLSADHPLSAPQAGVPCVLQHCLLKKKSCRHSCTRQHRQRDGVLSTSVDRTVI